MQGIEILFISVLVAFAQGTNSSHFPNWRSSWVEGGQVAAAGEFPYMASVRFIPGEHFICGGSIISERYILTSAYCVIRYRASSLMVEVGTITLNTGGTKHGVSGIATHPDYQIMGLLKDIGILKLRQPIAFSPRVHPIQLPNQNEIVELGTVCDFGGWGIISENGPYSNILLKLQIITVPSVQCLPYNRLFDDTKLCARAQRRTGPCKGDSGGPLICGGKQIGILSGGGTSNTRCKTGFPLDFVYVSKYINWIRGIMI